MLAHGGFAGASYTQARSISYKRFKLGSCKPSTTASTVKSAEDIPAGHIEVTLTQVVDTGVQKKPAASALTAAAPSSDAANKKLPEGKKVCWVVQASETYWLLGCMWAAVFETGSWDMFACTQLSCSSIGVRPLAAS